MDTRRSLPGARWTHLLILTIILPILLSCSIAGNLGQSQAPTEAIILPPQETVVVLQPPTPEIVLLPTNTTQPIETVQPTETSTAEVLPTETPNLPPVPEFIEIKNLELIGWHLINSNKCMDPKNGCWLLSTYKEQATIIEKEYIYIDPAWVNPFLVFQQKFESKGQSTFGFLEISADNEIGWTQIAGYNGTTYVWKVEAIDLNEYKGREITFRINFIPTTDPVSTKQSTKFNEHIWYIADLVIFTDYHPE